MPRFKVTFHQLIQDSQDFGSNDEHMVSRVFFTLEVDGKKAGDFYADLKQVVGSQSTSGDTEVSAPDGYDGPFDHQHFSEEAKKYFNSLIGSAGSGIRIQGSASNIRMRNNRFVRDSTVYF